jgi:protein involved in polysaccharide export with SLBB domain
MFLVVSATRPRRHITDAMSPARFRSLRFTSALALLLFAGWTTIASAQDGVEAVARRSAAALIRPGDRIDLNFRRDRELSGAVNVNERGEAVLPKLGTVRVSHIRIADLQDTLQVRYSEYLKDAEIDAQVMRRVVVNGEVKVPNVYMLDVTSGVRDAIARAGGVLETGNKNNVSIVRDGKRTRVRNWEQQQGPETDLASGDQVIIGRKSWFVLNALPLVSTGVIVIGLIRSIN